MCNKLQRCLCWSFINDAGHNHFRLSNSDFGPLFTDDIQSHNILLAMRFLSLQSFISDGKSSSAKLLSSMSEIGASLFTILETHFSTALESPFPGTDYLIQEQHKVLCERMKITIRSLVSSESPSLEEDNATNTLCGCDHKVAACSQLSRHNSLVVILFSALFAGMLYFFYCTCLQTFPFSFLLHTIWLGANKLSL